jgi:hypothetical protein
MEPGKCAYGASICPRHPFLCELADPGRPLRGADVLAALRPARFRSPVPTLDAEHLAWPDAHGERADEVHNDLSHQHLFTHPEELEDEELEDSPDREVLERLIAMDERAHDQLRSYVRDNKLWYVLLHTTPEEEDGVLWSRYVVLFAVGRSPAGDRLLGVVAHQVCHNLCD